MKRLPAGPDPAHPVGAAARCACGLLAGMAVVGASTFGTAAPAGAAPQPLPGSTMPAECHLPIPPGDWHTMYACREAWRQTQQERWRADMERRMRRPQLESLPPPFRPHRPPSPPAASRKAQPSARFTTRAPSRPVVPAAPPATATPNLVTGNARSSEPTQPPQANYLKPVLLLGLLLPAAAAVGYPMRRRIHSVVGASFASSGAPPAPQKTAFTYRPAIDPFAVPSLALAGTGAPATARVLALSALENFGDTALVVMPRLDAMLLFALAEDDLLDETPAGLFIPGNLDAALAYLETELAVRRDTGALDAPRLLLVADCGKDARRIEELQERHPEEFTTVLLGDWPGDKVTVDGDGLVEASPALAGVLPEHLPAMSRIEARDRLYTVIKRHRPPRGNRSRGSHRRRRR